MIDNAGRQLILQRNGLGADRGDVFFSPDEVANEQLQVNTLVDSLGVDVNAHASRLPRAVVTGFGQFWTEWKAFYKARSGFFARHERSTYEKTLEYRAQATTWQQKIAAAGKKVGVALTALPLQKGAQDGDADQSQTTKILKYVGVGTLLLVGLLIAGKLVHTIMLGEGALGQSGRGRTRRRERRWTLAEAESAALALFEKRRARRRR